MSEKLQQNERLSAFIDAELSESQSIKVVDDLLNDEAYKSTYARLQLVSDSLDESHEQQIISQKLRLNIENALEEMPAHFIEDAVNMHVAKTDNVTKSLWYNKLFENRLVSGISVAASVMLVTLVTLQTIDSTPETSQATNNILATTGEQSPSLIQAHSELPTSLVATSAGSADNETLKQQYQWIEADPVLSRQIREYINEHETHRAPYSLQPKIRSANYQFREQ